MSDHSEVVFCPSKDGGMMLSRREASERRAHQYAYETAFAHVGNNTRHEFFRRSVAYANYQVARARGFYSPFAS